MRTLSLESVTHEAAYTKLMRLYAGVLRETESDPVWLNWCARPLLVYYAQSHVGQRVTQLRGALVRSRACGGRPAQLAKVDARVDDLDLLGGTLQRRVTIGRLTAAVSAAAAAVTLTGGEKGWLKTHPHDVSVAVVAVAVAVLAADLAGTYTFARKLRIFERAGVYGQEARMYGLGFLPQGPERCVPLHLPLWDALSGVGVGSALWRFGYLRGADVGFGFAVAAILFGIQLFTGGTARRQVPPRR
jgi:hypothetical protein